LITGTTSISKMVLHLGLAAKDFPAQALASNRSLVQLSVTGYYDVLDPIPPSFAALRSISWALSHCTYNQRIGALAVENGSLKNLTLDGIELNPVTLGLVVSALEINSTLVCLGLLGSFKDDQTDKLMIDFVQNSCNRGTSRLKELRFPPRDNTESRTFYFHGYAGKPVTATNPSARTLYDVITS
jgi:hypothetical protein